MVVPIELGTRPEPEILALAASALRAPSPSIGTDAESCDTLGRSRFREHCHWAGRRVGGPVHGLDVPPDLAVLIVSYQSAADLRVLLDSLRAACGRPPHPGRRGRQRIDSTAPWTLRGRHAT